MGESGYTEAARRILATGALVREAIMAIPGLRVLGDPLWVIAFAADDGAAPGAAGIDIFQVMENMAQRGWSLNGLQRPPAVHLAVTLRHTRPGVASRFVADLRACTERARANPGERTGMAPVYGMAAALPDQVVRDLLADYLDLLFTV
jgi:hypothetical protein